MMSGRGESGIGAIEMKRYEACSVSPAPDSHMIVAAVLVTWTDSLITTVKMAGKEDWPIAHGAFAMGAFFNAILVDWHIQILLESDDMIMAFDGSSRTRSVHTDQAQYGQSVQW
jgi:hypothetical protein